MTANLFKRGNTYWWRAMIDGTTHRRSTGQKDYDLAKKTAREFDRAVRAGESTSKMPTFGEWVLAYMASPIGARSPDRKGAEIRDPPLLRPAVLAWGDRRLDAIKRSDCELLVAEMRASGVAPGTVWLRCVRIRMMFQLAINAGILTAHPWPTGKTGIKVPKPPKRKRVLTKAEEGVLRGALPPHWARLVTVAVGTGLRRGELLSIAPEHRIDGALRIPAEFAKNGIERMIPLRPEVAAALDEQSPPTSSAPYWACNKFTPAEALRRMRLSLGWPRLTLHDLRRTFGTRCAEAGMPLSHLQKLMGHSNPAVTASYYVFVGENSVRDSLLKIDL